MNGWYHLNWISQFFKIRILWVHYTSANYQIVLAELFQTLVVQDLLTYNCIF